MSNAPTVTKQPGTTKRYRVVAIEWLSHHAYIEAASKEEAEEIGSQMWADNGESEAFSFDDGDLETIIAEPIDN